MIIVDDDPGYYEQLAVCPRPGGVLIASAAYRNVKFHTVDRANRVWIVPLMLSSDEGIVGTCANGIVFSQVPPDCRKGEFGKIKLLILNAKSLDLNRFEKAKLDPELFQ